MNDYEKQATDFLEKTGVEFKAEFLKYDFHFEGDDMKRDIYQITLERGVRKYTFNFGQSIANSRYYYDKVTKRKYGEGKEFYVTVDFGNKISVYKDKFFGVIVPYSSPNILNVSKKRELIRRGVLKLGTRPTAYDVLACLQKYDPRTFEDFCMEFGYDTDSRKAEKIYNAVREEYMNIAMLWSEEEIEELAEIN